MAKQIIAGKKPATAVVKPQIPQKKEMSKLEKLLCGSGSDSVRPAKEVAELISKGAFILDVRTMFEAKKGVAPGAKSIPLLRLKRHLDELPKNKTIVTYCGTGARAGKAKDILEAAGFKAVNGGTYEGMLDILKKINHNIQGQSTAGNFLVFHKED